MQHSRLFALALCLLLLLNFSNVFAQGHWLQVDDGSSHYSLIKPTIGALGVSFTLPSVLTNQMFLTQGVGSPTVSNAWLQGGNNNGTGSPDPIIPNYGKMGTLDNVDLSFITGGLGNVRMTIVGQGANAGNVGIGDATPKAPLSFANVGGAKIFLFDAGVAGQNYGFGINPAELQSFVYNAAGGRWTWNSGGDLQPSGTNEKMRLDATTGTLTIAGNLGIGTNNPGSQLTNIGAGNNITNAGGDGLVGSSINWQMTSGGYTVGLQNNDAATGNANGLIVKTRGVAATNRIFTANSGAVNGTDRFQVFGDGSNSQASGNFTVSNSGDLTKIKNVTYSWPAANAAFALANDGAGNLSWTAAALFHVTETYSTSAPYDAVNHAGERLQSTGAATAIDLVLTPKGNGALLANLADNTVTGGNIRGTNSVDWQMTRSANTQVAGGAFSVIGGGRYNIATNTNATISGGQSGTATGLNSTIGGGFNNLVSGDYSTVSGGNINQAAGHGSFIGGGGYDGTTTSGNTASGKASVVSGGLGNTANGDYATVGGGASNTASNLLATVTGGYQNTASNQYATVGGGYANTTSGYDATVGGGYGNTASGYAATVSSGFSNLASAQYATVAGGTVNTASGYASMVGGGYSNTANNTYATVGGGQQNTASNQYATVAGGGINAATNGYATVGGGWQNAASGISATVGGGYQNAANNTSATVSGGQNNTAGNQFATVGGGRGNVASGIGSFVGGGGTDGTTNNPNQATGKASVVVGGFNNTAGGAGNGSAFVGGGFSNSAIGDNSVIGGGYQNTASGAQSFIGTGFQNQALGFRAVIGGGITNNIGAAASGSVIGGGYSNIVNGSFSAVPGGIGLTLSNDGNFGFLGNNNTNTHNMTVANVNTVTFGNTDLWLANNDNAARALRFYQAQNTAGAFPAANIYYSGFKTSATVQSDNYLYTWPSTAPAASQSLMVTGIAGSNPIAATLAWVNTPSGSGTLNYIPKWTSATALGNSLLSDDGTAVTSGGNLIMQNFLVTSSTGSLSMSETGGGFGGSKITVKDAAGMNGLLIDETTSTVNVADLALQPGPNAVGVRQSNIRLEARAVFKVNTSNTNGEFQFIDNSIVGPATTMLTLGNSAAYIAVNLGIGVTPPTATLDVNGTARIRNLSGAGTNIVTTDANGNLGNNTLAGLGAITGSGTANTMTKWTAASAIGNSALTDNGTTLGYSGTTFSLTNTGGAVISTPDHGSGTGGVGALTIQAGNVTAAANSVTNGTNLNLNGGNCYADGFNNHAGVKGDVVITAGFDNYFAPGTQANDNGSVIVKVGNFQPEVLHISDISQHGSGAATAATFAFNLNGAAIGAGNTFQVGTAGTNGNGALLTNGGTWTNASSRNFKERFTSLNGEDILSKIKGLNVEGWYYKGSNEYHIGPIAEDFYSAFRTGNQDNESISSTHISSVDPAGIALVGVQELAKKNEELQLKVDQLTKEIEEIKAMLKK